jgi:hypothetical protein
MKVSRNAWWLVGFFCGCVSPTPTPFEDPWLAPFEDAGAAPEPISYPEDPVFEPDDAPIQPEDVAQDVSPRPTA